MPSDRKFVPFRPDDTETVLLAKIKEKRGGSMSRILATALREYAEREGITATKEEVAEVAAERTAKSENKTAPEI